MGQAAAKPLSDPAQVRTETALAEHYEAKVRPMETRHLFEDFYSPPMDPVEFHSKPTILLLGQYSVGKTSMITYLLGGEYPGASIGPEPTTDVFVFIQQGTAPEAVPGAALVSDRDFPFRGIAKFGTDFLGKLRGSYVTASILKTVNFIDTPGILSGEKQRNDRGYDFEKVVKFLAQKVDRIWVLFDASKMDISDEYKLVLNCLAGNEEKVRIILNKADSVKTEELVRVRGALMWNLGKIFHAPEVPPVLIGSFLASVLNGSLGPSQLQLRQAFLKDYRSLVRDVRELPQNAPLRKINDLVKRARHVEVHALVMDAILRRGPDCACQGRKGAVRKWTRPHKLRAILADLEVKEKVVDWPDLEEFAAAARLSNPARWARIRQKQREALRQFLAEDIPRILEVAKKKGLPMGHYPVLAGLSTPDALKEPLETSTEVSPDEAPVSVSAPPASGSVADASAPTQTPVPATANTQPFHPSRSSHSLTSSSLSTVVP